MIEHITPESSRDRQKKYDLEAVRSTLGYKKLSRQQQKVIEALFAPKISQRARRTKRQDDQRKPRTPSPFLGREILFQKEIRVLYPTERNQEDYPVLTPQDEEEWIRELAGSLRAPSILEVYFAGSQDGVAYDPTKDTPYCVALFLGQGSQDVPGGIIVEPNFFDPARLGRAVTAKYFYREMILMVMAGPIPEAPGRYQEMSQNERDQLYEQTQKNRSMTVVSIPIPCESCL